MLITQLFLHACLNWLDYLSFQNFKIDFNIKILSLKCSDAKKKTNFIWIEKNMTSDKQFN